MKIDLAKLERTAKAAQAVDVEEFRRKVQNSLSRGRDGIHRPVRVPEEIDAHIAANDPPVTLALIAYIRELQAMLADRAEPYDKDARELLDRGAVIG